MTYIEAIRQLVLIASDDLIDRHFSNRNGLVDWAWQSPWTRERVTAHRSHHKIPVFRAST